MVATRRGRYAFGQARCGLFLSLGLALACAGAPKMVRGTNIEATPENEQIIDILERYREGLQRRDAAAIIALVSPRYHEDSGTPAATDDYGYDRLKEVIKERLGRLENVRYGIEYRKITIKRSAPIRPSAKGELVVEALAEVEVYVDASFQLASSQAGGNDRYRRVAEYNRLELEHDGQKWRITAGL